MNEVIKKLAMVLAGDGADCRELLGGTEEAPGEVQAALEAQANELLTQFELTMREIDEATR
jgi:hypothetical protein